MLKKIKSWNIKICRHPEHNPPKFISLEPGLYEHTCPSCGNKQLITVRGFTLNVLKNRNITNIPENFKYIERRSHDRRLDCGPYKYAFGRTARPGQRKYGRRNTDPQWIDWRQF